MCKIADLSSNHDRSWGPLLVRLLLDACGKKSNGHGALALVLVLALVLAPARGLLHTLTVVVGDDVQAVEQLALVLVDPFDLNVEHGVGVDLHLVVILQVHGELHLVFLSGSSERL